VGRLRNELAGQTIYLDANIFIYALEGIKPWDALLSELFIGMVNKEYTAITSSLSIAECLVMPFKRRADLISVYQEALTSSDYLNVVPITDDILISAAQLRAQTGLKLPDALHLASAFAHQCQSLITNDAGFKRITEINIYLLSEQLDALC